jgi:hypothetical protein
VVTLLCALAFLLFAGWMTWLHLTVPPVDTVAAPEDALALVVARGMELNEGLHGTSDWERRLHQLVTTDGGNDLEQAIAWYEELADHSLDARTEVQLAILYGEAGDLARLERLTASWPRRAGPLAELAPVVASAYTGPGDADDEAERAVLLERLPGGWFADRLALAWATRVGDAALRSQASLALAMRARHALWRARALAVMNGAVAAVGVIALVALWRRRGRPDALAVGAARMPPPWSGTLGLVVLIRGGAGAAAVILVLSFTSGLLGSWLDLEHPVLDAVTWPLMYLPLFLLARRYLLAPSGIGFRDALGLRLVAGGGRRLALVSAALVVAGAAVTTVLALGGARLQLTSHWSEWFDGDLAFGGPAAIAGSLAGAVVLAPFFEEVVFRGLLFATLRRGMRASPAIVVSAAIFAIAHGYGAVGLADVLWSGVLWAWAFERTGSVLPGMAAHAATNLLVSVTVLVLLR